MNQSLASDKNSAIDLPLTVRIEARTPEDLALFRLLPAPGKWRGSVAPAQAAQAQILIAVKLVDKSLDRLH